MELSCLGVWVMSKRTVKNITPKLNPFTEKPKLKVCAYVRVSTDHSGQMNSLQNQTEHYEHRLRSNAAYEYCGIYSDAGISGAKENRPGFQAMIEKALAGDIDDIFTKSISRFARNTIMLLKYVRELKDTLKSRLRTCYNFRECRLYIGITSGAVKGTAGIAW